jgi:hypothetical protein
MEITDLKKLEAPFVAQIGPNRLAFRQRLFTTDRAQELDDERVALTAEWSALRLEGTTPRRITGEDAARVEEIEARLREIAAESFVERIVEWPFRENGQPIPLDVDHVKKHFGSDPQYLANIVGWADRTRYPKPETGSS